MMVTIHFKYIPLCCVLHVTLFVFSPRGTVVDEHHMAQTAGGFRVEATLFKLSPGISLAMSEVTAAIRHLQCGKCNCTKEKLRCFGRLPVSLFRGLL